MQLVEELQAKPAKHRTLKGEWDSEKRAMGGLAFRHAVKGLDKGTERQKDVWAPIKLS